MNIAMSTPDWWALFQHFCLLSLLGVGGAITTAPEMHRFLVDEHHWLNDIQFTTSIALAQASPIPLEAPITQTRFPEKSEMPFFFMR